MRDVKKNSPEKKCKLVYDRLLVEDKVFIFRFLNLNLNIIDNHWSIFSLFSEGQGRVVEDITKRNSDDIHCQHQQLTEKVDDLQ